jgi:hypothetical protein
MGARRPYVAMQIDLGRQCDVQVESGTSIDLNISLRVFSYRAHGRDGGRDDSTVVDKVGVVAPSVRLAYGVHAALGTVRSIGGSRLHQKKVRIVCP